MTPSREEIWQIWKADVHAARDAGDKELVLSLAKLEPPRGPRTPEQKSADANESINDEIRRQAGRL